MRRFFKQVSVRPANRGYAVFLDGRPLKNMADGREFSLPSQALAGFIAEEWSAAGEEFDLTSMPASRLTMGAMALKDADREAVVSKLIDAAKNDTLCFFAPYPEALTKRQEECWRPLIDRMNDRGCAFEPTRNLSPPPLAESTREFLKNEMRRADNIPLACLQVLSGVFGSVILAFAVREGDLTAKEAFEASCLEELFQNDLWHTDEEALTARQNRERDACLAAKVLHLYEGRKNG